METFGKLFSRDSIILWTLKSYRRNRKKNAGYMQSGKYNHIKFIRLKSPGQAEEFLREGANNQELIFD